MEWDYSRQESKLHELQEEICEYLKLSGNSDNNTDLANAIIKKYVRITPPEKEQMYLHMVTMDHISGRNGGRSVKAGNIRLNMNNLMEAISGGVFTVMSVNDQHWAIPFAALLLWNSLWRNLEIALNESDVIILVVLHKVMKNKLVTMPYDEILLNVNKRMEMYEMNLLSKKDLEFSINKLDSINSIDKKKDGSIFVKEWIQISYR